ncbi:MAG: hypothetical protein J7M40_11755 [Planctomycetes bacterium]|nr:hypothetical protein [Planctomycetota bacterium]
MRISQADSSIPKKPDVRLQAHGTLVRAESIRYVQICGQVVSKRAFAEAFFAEEVFERTRPIQHLYAFEHMGADISDFAQVCRV